MWAWVLLALGQSGSTLQPSEVEDERASDTMALLRAANNAPDVSVPLRPIRVHTSSSGVRSLMAERQISSGELLVAVAVEDMMVSSRPHPALHDIIYNCTDGSINKTLWKGNHPFTSVWLVLNLLFHASEGNQSQYVPYINSLPRRFGTPISWTDEDLTELAGTSLSPAIIELNKSLRWRWYQNLFPALFEYAPKAFVQRSPFFSKQWFDWAMAVVDSRAFGIQDNGIAAKALVPLVDCANHATGVGEQAPADWQFDGHKFTVSAMQSFVPDSEVMISYGAHNNAELLWHYGFTLPDNHMKELPRPSTHWPRVEAAISKALTDFKTSQQEDEQLLQQAHQLSRNQLNALRVRMGERAALLGLDKDKVADPERHSMWRYIPTKLADWVAATKKEHGQQF